MKKIIIKTQADMDALSLKFEEYTQIQIHGGTKYDRICVKVKYENSSVVAYENSSVVAYDNSSVVAYENSSVVARDNSSVEARGNSSVVARDNSSVVAYENSSVVAYENSSVVARDNSSVEAWDNSSVVARDNSSIGVYEFALISVLCSTVIIKHLADYAVASLRGVEPKILKMDETATIVKTPQSLKLPFEKWLERGWVYADGIYKKFVSRKSIGEIEVFTVQDFPHKTESFVVKRGDQFSHGKTVEKAIESLRYKLSDRDTERFKVWDINTKVSIDDAIQAYMAITGACEYGVRSFCESIKMPDSLTVSEIIEITKEKYGNKDFELFFKDNKC